MDTFKIGAIADSFRKGPREGVRAAKQVGAEGFQIYAVSGEISPEGMDAAARKAFRAAAGYEKTAAAAKQQVDLEWAGTDADEVGKDRCSVRLPAGRCQVLALP
jgi:hypothetical protein